MRTPWRSVTKTAYRLPGNKPRASLELFSRMLPVDFIRRECDSHSESGRSIVRMVLDIQLGILWSVLVGLAFDQPITFLWVFSGIAFALLPDIDFWIEFARRGTVGGKTLGEHRTLLHNPLLYIPAALLVGSVCGNAWMILFALGVFGHHIHDTMGMGFGVRWLWPFSGNFYKTFSDRAGNIHYDSKHILPVSWTPDEIRAVIREKGNDTWLEEDLAFARRHALQIIAKSILFVLIMAALVFFARHF